jgi:hypothetical protein
MNEIRTTVDQLSEDFGSPHPDFLHKPAAPADEFNIRRISKLQHFLIHQVDYVKAFSLVVSSAARGTSNEMLLDMFPLTAKQTTESLQAAKNHFDNLPTLAKPFFLVLCLLILAPILAFKFLIALPKITVPPKSFEDLNGQFKPFPWRKNSIFVLSKASTSKLSEDVTIAHEHIHLLQYRYRHLFFEKGGRVLVENELTQLYLAPEEPPSVLESLKYLTKPSEIEARLHELLVSNYRQFGVFPKNRVEVFLMFARCEELCANREGLMKIFPEIKAVAGSQMFSLRVERTGTDLMYVLSAFDDMKINERFFFEVVPCMVARLLWYYGAHEESVLLGTDIPHPNLEAQIYSSR